STPGIRWLWRSVIPVPVCIMAVTSTRSEPRAEPGEQSGLAPAALAALEERASDAVPAGPDAQLGAQVAAAALSLPVRCEQVLRAAAALEEPAGQAQPGGQQV